MSSGLITPLVNGVLIQNHFKSTHFLILVNESALKRMMYVPDGQSLACQITVCTPASCLPE